MSPTASVSTMGHGGIWGEQWELQEGVTDLAGRGASTRRPRFSTTSRLDNCSSALRLTRIEGVNGRTRRAN